MESFTFKCTFMYDVYGIVKVKKYSNNKGLQLYLSVTLFL